jgi:SAM-dependent methyltransferase
MLAQLLDKISGEDRCRLTVLQQNAESLTGLADGSFDGATILLALYDMSRPRAAFDEVLRVLRPGGSLVVTEPKATFRLQPLLAFVERFLVTEGSDKELRDDWERVRLANLILDPARREARLGVEEIRERLVASGFHIERGADSHLGQCATTWATKRS